MPDPSASKTRPPATRLAWRVRRLLTRKYLDGALDRLRFRLDTSPRSVSWLRWLPLPEIHAGAYHDLPWVGIDSGRRGDGSGARLEVMKPVLSELGVTSAVDIGSSVGWFTFTLTELGIPTVGVERDPRALRSALYVRSRAKLNDASFVVADLTKDNLRAVPHADCFLVLSIWHHWVREFGLADATAIVEGLWAMSSKVLFFDTGENEMPASWNLPAMLPDPDTWLATYLTETCTGSTVRNLGRFDALGPNNEPCQRSLLAVVRARAASD